MRILVSACLLGENCKYNGGNNYSDKVLTYLAGHEIVAVCPEILGGLPSPRPSCEIVKGVIMSKDGKSFDMEFKYGANRALEIAIKNKVDCAILQPRSPSCGVSHIYDGTFSGRLIPGKGCFAQLLFEHGVRLIDAEKIEYEKYECDNGVISMNIQKKLFELQDKKYANFQSKLIPTVNPEFIIGVRVPVIRKMAKEMIRNSEHDLFMEILPHKYLEENILHGVILSEIKDYYKCIYELDRFLPYVDNWAVCDIISPKIFKKYKDDLIEHIKGWISLDHSYECRFGIEMLMSHYLDDNFEEEYLELPARVMRDEYYVKMMVAWFFATALAKQWESSIKYIENNELSKWVHNKTIQKACESYRISSEHKVYLRGLKR